MAHYRHVIVDGNNFVHRDPDLSVHVHGPDFDEARRALIRKLDAISGVIAERVCVVFDGREAGPALEYCTSSVEVSFASSRDGADAVIERMVAAAARPDDITVVTSDHAERRAVEADGGQTLSCEAFLDEMRNARGSMARSELRRVKRKPRNTLGDYFPDLGK